MVLFYSYGLYLWYGSPNTCNRTWYSRLLTRRLMVYIRDCELRAEMLLTKSSVATRKMYLCEGDAITHEEEKLEKTGLCVGLLYEVIYAEKFKMWDLRGCAVVPKSWRSPTSKSPIKLDPKLHLAEGCLISLGSSAQIDCNLWQSSPVGWLMA
jgi:hypothetical protein